jgi:hypothetical protein
MFMFFCAKARGREKAACHSEGRSWLMLKNMNGSLCSLNSIWKSLVHYKKRLILKITCSSNIFLNPFLHTRCQGRFAISWNTLGVCFWIFHRS